MQGYPFLVVGGKKKTTQKTTTARRDFTVFGEEVCVMSVLALQPPSFHITGGSAEGRTCPERFV